MREISVCRDSNQTQIDVIKGQLPGQTFKDLLAVTGDSLKFLIKVSLQSCDLLEEVRIRLINHDIPDQIFDLSVGIFKERVLFEGSTFLIEVIDHLIGVTNIERNVGANPFKIDGIEKDIEHIS